MLARRVHLVILAAILPACASDRETQNLVDTLPVAATTGNAHQLAAIIQQELDASNAIAEAEKADLRARAQVLEAHAENLSRAIDLYDPAGKQNTSITLNNLRARAKGLEEECRAARREWGIWQVCHDLKKPDEIFEIFDYDETLKN